MAHSLERMAADTSRPLKEYARLFATIWDRLEHVHSYGVRQMRSAATLPRSASQASPSASSAGDSCRPRMPQHGLHRGTAKKASGRQNANDSGFSGGNTRSARDLNCSAKRGLLAGAASPQ